VSFGPLYKSVHSRDHDIGYYSCILDGEMMVWDPALDKYLGFGTLKTAAIGTYTPICA
jgi:ATP-dependent DNA ligase